MLFYQGAHITEVFFSEALEIKNARTVTKTKENTKDEQNTGE